MHHLLPVLAAAVFAQKGAGLVTPPMSNTSVSQAGAEEIPPSSLPRATCSQAAAMTEPCVEAESGAMESWAATGSLTANEVAPSDSIATSESQPAPDPQDMMGSQPSTAFETTAGSRETMPDDMVPDNDLTQQLMAADL